MWPSKPSGWCTSIYLCPHTLHTTHNSRIFGVFLITIVKKLWRSDNPYKHWTYKQSLIWSCVIGVLAGSAFQLLLQSFTEKWIYIDESNRYNLVIFGAICAPMVILYLYSAILWWAKRTKHDLIYEYFRVRHPKGTIYQKKNIGLLIVILQ